MLWELVKTEATLQDPHGLESFIRGLDQEFRRGDSPPLEGFTFLYDAREMLSLSRQIENDIRSARAGTLYVGFQNEAKLGPEADRYQRLGDAGVTVYAFGEGVPDTSAARGLTSWHSLEPHHARLENQWYLVADGAASAAFVGWEVSDDDVWGRYGVTHPDKKFAGFISDDTRVISALIAHFEELRSSQPAAQLRPPGALDSVLQELSPKRAMVLADDGKRSWVQSLLQALSLSSPLRDCAFYLYDLSAASYLIDPYPYQGEDQHHPLSESFVRNALKREYLADRVLQLSGIGASAEAILPTGVGFKDLAKWCNELEVDVLLLPSYYLRARLIDRLRGNTFALVADSVRSQIVLYDETGGATVY